MVIPLLAGWDLSHRVGRISSSTTVRWLLRTNGLRHDRLGSPFAESTCGWAFAATWTRGALDLGALALYEAGDNDPSTAVRTSSGASFP